jgi:hypothetical protein
VASIRNGIANFREICSLIIKKRKYWYFKAYTQGNVLIGYCYGFAGKCMHF